MNRKELANVLKEILDNCQEIASANVVIMPPDADDTLAKGEQLHSTATVDETTMQCLKSIIEKNRLKAKEEASKIIVFESATTLEATP